MERCLQLAKLGEGRVHPNPMVGAILVHEGIIIGEGYHRQFGAAHAEVNAIQSVKVKDLLPQSVLYVSLEPCCHFGKTPPCADLIIESGIKKVVMGCLDPNPAVAGKGLEKLKSHGIEVLSGVLESQCQALNAQFVANITQKREVQFILKWAETEDGFIGRENYLNKEERIISNPLVQRYVHQLRSRVNAIMVGTHTVLTDNPFLDNRYWYGNVPHVILIDRRLKIPRSSRLFAPDRKVFILNEQLEQTEGKIIHVKINFDKDETFWPEVNTGLASLGLHTVLIEGGGITLNSFAHSGLKAEVIRITSTKNFGAGVMAPHFPWSKDSAFYLGDNIIELGKLNQ